MFHTHELELSQMYNNVSEMQVLMSISRKIVLFEDQTTINGLQK